MSIFKFHNVLLEILVSLTLGQTSWLLSIEWDHEAKGHFLHPNAHPIWRSFMFNVFIFILFQVNINHIIKLCRLNHNYIICIDSKLIDTLVSLCFIKFAILLFADNHSHFTQLVEADTINHVGQGCNYIIYKYLTD